MSNSQRNTRAAPESADPTARRSPSPPAFTQPPPPAFQMYAAEYLADRNFKTLSAIERGVLLSVMLECWVNLFVPADANALARVLGLDVVEIQAGLTERAMRYLERRHDAVDGEIFIHPRLEKYRAKLAEHHLKKSRAGKKGQKDDGARTTPICHPIQEHCAMATPLALPMAP